ncbi:MAG: addiction module toxin, HicA family [Bacteroidales bacterium]|jgi:predicted RNA binding protein YcfA (HicA-like mRNA interferase family)|nr:addiction module toxin, HicA family [Bacteroidales bacterium]
MPLLGCSLIWKFKHPEKKGLVTVSGKPADDVKKGTLGSVLRQANIKQT